MPGRHSDTRYRFHGRIPPEQWERTPLAQVETTDVSDGVATLRLYDPIDSWGGEWGVSAKEFAGTLDALGEVEQIQMHVNSPGGEVFEGIAIANALRNHPARVTAVVDGLAASAASFIASAADELVMGRNTELMIHDAWGICMGDANDMRDLATRLDQLSNNIASIYAAKAGGTVQDWRTAMLVESWYTAEEAVEAGLADRVEGSADASAKNRFDLSVFNYEGRTQAPPPPVLEEQGCHCGSNGEDISAKAGYGHKDECPEASQKPEPSGPSNLQVVRHRMNARKHRLTR